MFAMMCILEFVVQVAKNIEREGWDKNCVCYLENMLVTNEETDSAQIFTKSQ